MKLLPQHTLDYIKHTFQLSDDKRTLLWLNPPASSHSAVSGQPVRLYKQRKASGEYAYIKVRNPYGDNPKAEFYQPLSRVRHYLASGTQAMKKIPNR